MGVRIRSIVFTAFVALATAAAPAQTPASPEQAVVDALRADPLLLPYPIRVATGKSGEIILSGKVGSRALHDMAIRTVLDMGLVPHDALTIDTSEAYRVAAEQGQAAAPVPYFVYPEPLFGRLDEPFWGMEPPILSFPPGYARRAGPSVADARLARTPEERMRRADAPPIGKLDLTVDEFGQVHLSGVAASEEDRRRIVEEAMRTPGVTRVSSDLKVLDRATPPPPPVPFDGKPVETMPVDQAKAEPPPPPADRADLNAPGALTERIEQALERRPALKGLKIDASVRNGAVTLRGEVPSAYEAMLAFRAVERTPGVREVVDELEFPLPDENTPNPLLGKARPDDLEPYLLYQIRRHAGDTAHVDRVDVLGDVVKVRGTLAPGESAERMGAVLRSMPLLRDFRIEPTFSAD